MKQFFHTKKGFTLVEMILYIALVSIFISGAIKFAWDIIYSRTKSEVERSVNANLRLGAGRIAYEIRNASALNSVSSSSICLASANSSYNPTRIYLSSGQMHIAWGGGTADCSAMTNDAVLTTNDVSVTDLSFTNYSTASVTYNVGFSFTVQSTGTRNEWQKTQTYSSAVEMRSRL